MSIMANNNGGDFTPVPAGTYPARCYSMIDLGTIKETFNGEDKELHKVRISWELPTETKVFKEELGEQPYSVSKDFTLSMNNKANLRKFLESWRGRGFTEEEAKSFDVTKLLGKSCMLSVIHKISGAGKTYPDISSVTTLPKGLICPDQVNKSFEFSFAEFSEPKFNGLPDWLKDKMRTSREYKNIMNPDHYETNGRDDADFDNSDLPF